MNCVKFTYGIIFIHTVIKTACFFSLIKASTFLLILYARIKTKPQVSFHNYTAYDLLCYLRSYLVALRDLITSVLPFHTTFPLHYHRAILLYSHLRLRGINNIAGSELGNVSVSAAYHRIRQEDGPDSLWIAKVMRLSNVNPIYGQMPCFSSDIL